MQEPPKCVCETKLVKKLEDIVCLQSIKRAIFGDRNYILAPHVIAVTKCAWEINMMMKMNT